MKNKRILFLNPYPVNKAPSQRLKYEQYFDAFREDGWQIDNSSFINEHFWTFIYKPGHVFAKFIQTFLAYIRRFFTILFQVPKYDVVYVHLWVSPFGPPFFEFLTVLLAKRVIYDIDDLVYLSDSSKANKFWVNLKGKKKMIYLMKKAYHVITCTPTLDKFVRKYTTHTTDISSTVDTDLRYQAKTDYALHSIPILGWSGSVTTARYLYLLAPALQTLSQSHNFKLIVIGDNNFNIDGVNVEAYDWSESIEIPLLSTFDIGLYPLPNEEWVYGKSGLKAIQYMALGIPTIATAIGTNFRVITNDESGLLIPVDDTQAWVNAIERLLQDATLREKLGKAGRDKVVKQFSISANKKTYLDILNNTIA